MKILTILLISALTAVLYQNCSQKSFTQGTDPAASTVTGQGFIPDPGTVKQAISDCSDAIARGSALEIQPTINFRDEIAANANQPVCPWGQGDNLAILDGYLRARVEQTATLNLPANAVICDVQMSSDTKSIHYDDVFYLTFNNFVVASNQKYSVDKLTSQSLTLSSGNQMMAHTWDWLKVRDSGFNGSGGSTNINANRDDYCLGAELGSTCLWPLSEQTGNFVLSINPEVLVNLSLAGKTQQMGFVVTGDNDPKSDCNHSDLNFSMKIKYILK